MPSRRLCLLVVPALLGGCLDSLVPAPGAVAADADAGPPAGGDPTTVPVAAISSDAVFVVNGGDSSISVIDPARNQVTSTIRLVNASWPHHIYLSADRARMLVAVPGMDLSGGHDVAGAEGGGAVLLLDTSTGATIAARRLEMMNHNAIFSPDGTEVWTSQMMMPGSILVLDAQTLATKQSVPVGDMPAEITFSRDGAMAFVANGMTDNVTVLDVRTKQVMATIPVGKDPVGPWPGIDGVMYTDCEQGKSISAIDSTTMAVVRTYDLGFTPGMVATPAAAAGELWVTDEDGGKLVFNSTSVDLKKGELPVGPGAHGIAFSADGSKAYVTSQLAGTVSVVDVATHSVTATIPVGNKPNGVVYRAR